MKYKISRIPPSLPAFSLLGFSAFAHNKAGGEENVLSNWSVVSDSTERPPSFGTKVATRNRPALGAGRLPKNGGKPRRRKKMSTQHYYLSDPALAAYFATLPASVRNDIVASGIEISTLGELQQCAQHMMERE